MSRFHRFSLILGACLAGFPLAAGAWAVASGPTDRAAAFDQLAERLERGEVAPGSRAEIDVVLGRLQRLVPAGDLRRELRYRYTYCILHPDVRPSVGVAYAEQGIKDALRAGDAQAEANFHYCRGEHQEALTTPRDALPDYTAGIAIARRDEDMRLVADGLTWRASVQSLLGEHAHALVDLLEAERLYQSTGNVVQRELNLLNIAAAYRRLGERSKAREYLDKSLAYARKRHDIHQQIAAEMQLGFLGTESMETAEAQKHFEAALALARAIGDHGELGLGYLGLAQNSNREGQYARALEELQQARVEFAGEDDHSNQGMLMLQSAEAHAGLGQHALAIDEYDKAEQLLRASGNLRYIAAMLDARARSYQALGKPAAAVADLRQMIKVHEALDRKAQSYNTTLMSYRFDTARRDQENRRLIVDAALKEQQLVALRRARQWQWLAMALGSALLVMLVGLAVRQFRLAGRMYRLAMTDALTGVANRRWIQDMAGRAVRQARLAGSQLTVLVFDIDHFKRINDIHGHQVGDQVLMRVVHACQTCLRHGDRLGRIGGEEFLVILPDTNLDAGREIAERLREQVNALELDDIAPTQHVTVSLGVAELKGPPESLESLVQRADRALYRAKACGRNRVESAMA